MIKNVIVMRQHPGSPPCRMMSQINSGKPIAKSGKPECYKGEPFFRLSGLVVARAFCYVAR